MVVPGATVTVLVAVALVVVDFFFELPPEDAFLGAWAELPAITPAPEPAPAAAAPAPFFTVLFLPPAVCEGVGFGELGSGLAEP